MSKKTTYTFLLFIFFVTLLLRIPDHWSTGSSTGSDSNSYHLYTQQILASGYIPWILDIASYFGMYPFSQPSGALVLVGTLSTVTGLHTDPSILIYSLFMGIIGTFNSFMVGRLIFGSKIGSIIVPLTYTLNRYFFIHTLWRLSIRGSFMAFMPLLLWCLLKLLERNSTNKRKIFTIFAGTLFMLFTFHRMVAYIFPTIIIPMIVIFIFYRIFKYRLQSSMEFNRKWYVRYSFQLMFIFTTSLAITIITIPEKLESLGIPLMQTWTESTNNPIIRAMNIARQYTQWGIIQFLSILGVFFVHARNPKSVHEKYIVSILPFQIIFIQDVEYYMPVFLITIAILTAYGANSIITNIPKKSFFMAFMILFILVIPTCYSYYMKDVATRVQVIRDSDPSIDQGYGVTGEEWGGIFWREEYIDDDTMILKNIGIWSRLGFTGKITTTEERFMVWYYGDIRNQVEIERYPLLQTLLHQKQFSQGGYYYGGYVSDWLDLDSDMYMPKNHHDKIIRGEYPDWYIDIIANNQGYDSEKLIWYYKVSYSVYFNGEVYGNIEHHYPIYDEIFETKYKLFDNEVMKFHFYNGWD